MRYLLVVLGHACVAVGLVGLFVPLLPTTPFLLLAAALYARGSERLHERLLAHPRLGPPVRDWLDHGVIHTRAKVIATLLVFASVSIPVLFQELPPAAKIGAVTVAAGVTAFLWSRPSAPRTDSPDAPSTGPAGDSRGRDPGPPRK